MEILDLQAVQSRQIDRYGSIGASFTPIIRHADGLSVVSIWLQPQGLLGLHPATSDQLFILIAGEAHVSTPEQDEVPVRSGMAVLWRKGEMHQTRAGTLGIQAIVIEAEGLAGFIYRSP